VFCTQLPEGNPNTVLEAMACGCPLVVSDIPEHREFLDDDCARFAKPDSAHEIARAILCVFAEPDATARRVQAARARVASRDSIPDMARRYERVYRAMVARTT
jgi:glycosyltransferase involved in cell wall biosynthesis